jgi:hypothetical protein
VAKTLTLEQVRKAGRFAWHEGGYETVDGSTVRKRGILYGAGVALPPKDGWHHLRHCDCEFCKVPEKCRGKVASPESPATPDQENEPVCSTKREDTHARR